jgi:DNA invertase Pin-like site-specific DNA recombinase
VVCARSTGDQTVDNQIRELTAVAEHCGWTIVAIYRDEGVSGNNGRDKRPGFNTMLKDAGGRKFDVVMAWAIDRVGRLLIHLLNTIQHLQDVGVDLYLDRQHLDTTTAQGKLLFHINSAFAEFERNMMIVERVNSGLVRTKDTIAKRGKFTSNAGKVRTRLVGPTQTIGGLTDQASGLARTRTMRKV